MRNLSLKIIAICLLINNMACKQVQNETTNLSNQVFDTLTDIWQLSPENQGISWQVKKPHMDHLEFSGLRVSAIITYGNDENGKLVLKKKVIWPMLRTIPNDTHASLIHDFDENINAGIKANGIEIGSEKPFEVSFNGILTIKSKTGEGLEIMRVLSPSVDKAAIVELVTITNKSGKEVKVEIDKLMHLHKTDKTKGVYGSYLIKCENQNSVSEDLLDGESLIYSQVYLATKENEEIKVDAQEEFAKRKEFIQSLNNSLVFESPNENLNQMFRFAKIRATESIYATKGGLMHGPGGSRYYAAIWANDQAEYINPFFPFLGNENGNESAINSFRHFARFMNDKFEPIPSSIVAEGTDIWNGAGDRGDAAMIAYGASRFALAYGNKATADSLLPLIKWSLKYCEHKMLPEGVISSDCDELENRFPAGKANLTTNMLAYGGYISAANLLVALDRESGLADEYRQKAKLLRKACETYFWRRSTGI
ncbi:MAG: hypothetical protein HC831_14700 [Chloroflexia bacterium]|nr:hypothetical protein [Chloroflexia bacterium]